MATIDGAKQAAQDVVNASLPGYPNHARPDIRLAMWAATLSAQRNLKVNGKLLTGLRPYVHRNEPLPTSPDTVLAILKSGAKFCCRNDAVHVCWVDWAYHQGLLEPLTHKPTDYAGWLQWRRTFLKIAGGHGFSWKTASFTALLMWPLDCPLVPVDRHVVARLYEPASLCERLGAWRNYDRLEQRVVEEWVSNGQPCGLGLWHWYTWSAWRQATGDEKQADSCESHAMLSPYAY